MKMRPVSHLAILVSLLAALSLSQPVAPVLAAAPVEPGSYDARLRPLLTTNAWSALGGGLNGSVRAIVINGSDLYAAGTFTDAGGDINADRIAKWNGSSWSALGSGIGNGQVNSLAFNGPDLYVGGSFTDAGGNIAADFIAQWNGSSWSTLGNGLTNTVNAIAVDGTNIYVAGNFTNAGGDGNANYIAKLDGGAWAALGASPLNQPINTIVVAGPTVYAAGNFTNLGIGGNPNLNHIAMWDGSAWTALGSGLSNTVFALILVGSDLYAGGAFNDAGGNSSADRVAKWDGSAWSPLGSSSGSIGSVSVNAFAVSGSNLYVGGNFDNAGGDTNADFIARWDGSAWSALGATPLTNSVSTILVNGLDVYAGGTFTNAGGDSSANRIALFQLDGVAPTVSSFTATSPSASLNIPITAFSASDNIAVSGYKITESSTPPAASATGWTVSAPASYTVSTDGAYTLYPWAKDATGNVSAVYGSPASVTVDSTAPAVTTFSAPASSTSLTISGISFSASDNVGVTGYKITESSTPPSAGAVGWTGSAPTSYTVSGSGSYTLYPWAKDALGNVSAVYGSPAGVSVDNAAPTVTAFSVPSPSASLEISISTFSASDNIGVTGYLVTESSTVPSAGDSGWTGSAPATYTVAGNGSYTLYPWAKDALGNVSAVYGSPASVTVDNALPTVTAFSVPSSSTSLDVSINTFSASDDVGVTGYLITESSTAPLAGDSGWTGSAPATYTVAGNGSYTLYPWAKDALGNVSPVYGSPAVVSVDVDAPTVTGFSVPATSTSLDVPLTTFTASDNVGATGYLVTESSTVPSAGDAGWTGSAPTTYAVSGSGSYTLYPWAKDAAGNVSAVYGSPAGVSVDNTAPTVTAFSVPSSSTSLNVAITTFTASDNVGATGYLVTESSTVPSAGDAGWTASAPTTYTVSGSGSYTLYPWAKDAAGNVSAVYGSPAGVSVDNTAPTVTAFSVPSSSTSLNVAITTFTASDDIGVAAYLVTESSTPPSAGDAGWTASAPATYTVSTDGSYTLYPWAKDALGNVSAVYGSPAGVSVDTTAPGITINDPDTSPATAKTITASASDGTLTMSNTTGSTCDVSLSFVPYASQLFSSESDNGTKVCYKAVDAPGNTAYSLSNVIAGIDTTAPSISSITRVTASPSAKASLQFLVSFSEPVSGVTMADFSLTASVTGASITGISSDTGSTRTVTVNSGSGNGTLRLDIPNTAGVNDLAGNALSGLPYTGGEFYTINKTLTYTSAAAQDGWLLESSETSTAGGTLNASAATFFLGDAAADTQYRSVLSFNTASLPDNATLTGVTIKIKRPATGFLTGNNNPFTWGQGLKVDVCKLMFGTAGALQLTDFNYNNTTNCKLLAATFGATPSANWYSANLLSTAFVKVNKTGLTQFRLRFAKDDNDDGLADYLSFYSANAGAASRPQLVITYSVP